MDRGTLGDNADIDDAPSGLITPVDETGGLTGLVGTTGENDGIQFTGGADHGVGEGLVGAGVTPLPIG